MKERIKEFCVVITVGFLTMVVAHVIGTFLGNPVQFYFLAGMLTVLIADKLQ